MGVSKNSGTPKSSILIRFSITFTVHFGVPLFFGNIHMRLSCGLLDQTVRSRVGVFFVSPAVFLPDCGES